MQTDTASLEMSWWESKICDAMRRLFIVRFHFIQKEIKYAVGIMTLRASPEDQQGNKPEGGNQTHFCHFFWGESSERINGRLTVG